MVQRTLITTHKKYPVIAKIAHSMREHGYNRTPEEINTRIKNLKCFYNRVKKDLEIGVISSPSWPHYEAMDEILSRPIFGNNARMNLNQPHTSSQSSQSPKDSVAHLVESEIKEEQFSDDEMHLSSNGDLLMPKNEPDDDQHGELLDSEMEEDEDFEEEYGPPLPKLQKISSPKYASLPQLDKIVSHSVEIKLLETPPSSGSTVISSTPTTTKAAGIAATPANGKISLVPTNVLLKPQAQLKQVFKSQNGPTLPAQAVQTTTSQGMKVLLVNALSNGINSTTNMANTSQTVITTSSLPKLQPKPMPALQAVQVQPPPADSPKISIVPTKPEPSKNSTLRHMMNNLIRLQNENLTMQRQRLNIERQRLEYEKNIGGRVVDLLSVLAQQQQQLLANSTQSRSGYRLRREKKSNNYQSSGDDEEN